MSRETLLDDAIAKAREAEDWQLVEWLRMARGGESAARWYTEKLRDAHRAERKLKDENAKLLNACKRWMGKAARLESALHVLAYCSLDHDCDRCQVNGGDGPICLPSMGTCDTMQDMLRKLGIGEEI